MYLNVFFKLCSESINLHYTLAELSKNILFALLQTNSCQLRSGFVKEAEINLPDSFDNEHIDYCVCFVFAVIY